MMRQGEEADGGAPLPDFLREFLTWVAARPRSYAETMEAWRTSCPRLSAWEDATIAGLVRVAPGATGPDAAVVLTERGARPLAAAEPARPHAARNPVEVVGPDMCRTG